MCERQAQITLISPSEHISQYISLGAYQVTLGVLRECITLDLFTACWYLYMLKVVVRVSGIAYGTSQQQKGRTDARLVDNHEQLNVASRSDAERTRNDTVEDKALK